MDVKMLFKNSPEKLAPDACPKAKNRKRFDPNKSGALQVLMDHERGTYYPPGPSAWKRFFFWSCWDICVTQCSKNGKILQWKKCQIIRSTKVARSSYNFLIILSYPLTGLFKYLFMFWLHKHLPAKQFLNSKQSSKGYERIIREILRSSGYTLFLAPFTFTTIIAAIIFRIWWVLCLCELWGTLGGQSVSNYHIST